MSSARVGWPAARVVMPSARVARPAREAAAVDVRLARRMPAAVASARPSARVRRVVRYSGTFQL